MTVDVNEKDGQEVEYFPLINSKITIPTLDEYLQRFLGIPFTIEIKNNDLKATKKMLEIFQKYREILQDKVSRFSLLKYNRKMNL